MRSQVLCLGAVVLLSAASAHAQTPPAAPPPTPETTPAPADPALAPVAPAAPPDAVPAEAAAADAAADPTLMGADPAAMDASGELSAEELEALGFGAGAPAVDTDLKIFGFADFTVSFMPVPKSNEWRKLVTPHSSFYIGNFNLYLSKNLTDSVRTMSEVRVHYAPHGSGDVPAIYDDHADFGRPVRLGGVELERIYFEWQMFAHLTLRVGQFLTPYGIWNVDHGSPTYIPVRRPFVIGSALFPERQTGFELYGSWDATNSSTLGYHLTLSNGLGPITEIKDLDENKGVGGRVFWDFHKVGTLRVGGSLFYALDTTAEMVQGLSPNSKLTNTERINQQSKVLSLAADVQWQFKGFHLQVEVITQQRKFTSDGRVATTNPLTGQPFFPTDYTAVGAYGMLAYGFDIGTVLVRPYVLVQRIDEVSPTGLGTKVNAGALGLNVRPLESTVVKLEWVDASFLEPLVDTDKDFYMIQAQLAWAF